MINKIKKFIKEHLLVFEIGLALVFTIGGVYMFDATFSQKYLMALLVFIAMFVLIKKGLDGYNIRRLKYSLWFAVPMGVAFWFGHKITLQSIEIGVFSVFDLPSIIILIAIFCLLSICIFDYIDKKSFMPKNKIGISKKYWFIMAVVIFACWVPIFLSFFPGIVSIDSAVQIRQAIGEGIMSNWHPILYTLFITLLLVFS